MDALYRGLAAPRQVLPVGRDDIAPPDRPGTALVGMAREALETNSFTGPAADPDEALPERLPPAPPREASGWERAGGLADPDDHDLSDGDPDGIEADPSDVEEGLDA